MSNYRTPHSTECGDITFQRASFLGSQKTFESTELEHLNLKGYLPLFERVIYLFQRTMNPSETLFGETMSVFDPFGRIGVDTYVNRSLPPLEEGKMGERVEQTSKKCSKAMTRLPEGFEPGAHDVICGRGRNIWNSIGNVSFRKTIESRIDEYASAATKFDKVGFKNIRGQQELQDGARNLNTTALFLERVKSYQSS